MKSTKSRKDDNGFSSKVIINYLAIFAFCLLMLMSFIQGVQGSQPKNKGKNKDDRFAFSSGPLLNNENDEYGNRGPGLGNIGCLFSKSVCEENAEWCFDDYAFGRCLPTQGVVDEPKLYRYELSKSDTHALEKEMERLFALGYRWRHSYTQCVLQNLLEAQRRGSEWEQAVCSEEMDQDLEGALKAFADEIDPWNLAFVKFTPSKINPHANFADEMYRPPAQLPEVGIVPAKVVGGHDGNGNQKAKLNSHYKQPVLELTPPEEKLLEEALEDYMKEEELPINSIPSWKRKKSASPLRMRAGVVHAKRTTALTADNWKREVEQEAEDEALVDQQVGGESAPEDFGVGPGGVVDESILQPRIFSSLYNTPDLFRHGVELRDELVPRNGLGDGEAEGDEGTMSGQDDNDMRQRQRQEQEQEELMVLEQLALLAAKDEEQQRQLSAGAGAGSSAGASAGAELDLGFPLPQSIRADQRHRNSPAVEEERASNIPEFLPVPASALGSLSASGEDSNPHYTEGGLVFLKNDDTPKFLFDDDDLGSIGSLTNSPKKGNFLKRFFLGVDGEDNNGEDSRLGLGEEDLSRNGAFELSYGYGLGGGGAGAGAAGGGGVNGPQRAFERRERLDVKKPGPWYRTVNNFAFDNKQDKEDASAPYKDNPEFNNEEGPADMMSSSDHLTDSQLESELVSQSHSKDNSLGSNNNNDGANQQEMKESNQYRQAKSTSAEYGDGISKKSAPVNFKSPLPQTFMPHDDHLDIIDTSYVYIFINKKIMWNEANNLVGTLSDVLDVRRNAFSDIRVSGGDRKGSGEIITFKVGPNEKHWNASEVARRLNNLSKNDVKAIALEDGIQILRSDVGITNNNGPAVTLFDEDPIANNNLFIITFAVCGFVAAILVAAVSLFLIRKHAKTRQKIARLADDDPSFEACKDYQDLCRARMAGSKNNEKVEPLKGATQRVATTMSRDSENGTNSSRSSTSSWTEEPVLTNMDISTGHMVLSYMEDHLKKRDRLDQEWAGLCSYEADPCSTSIAEKPENNKKNRYSNSLPYDHSRVILNDLANINSLDYINASTITDHDPRNPAYIATQGPLAHTAADFWQMVWEQGSVVIVTLTRLSDNGTALCHRYWPEEGSELHHIYEVHLVSEHIWCDEYLVRSFYLKNLKTGETRTVTQFHFQAWPENSIPQSTKAILEFRRKVNKSYRGRSCPIIVHCSDGAGRTGTYCLIDMVLNRMAKGAKEIDIAASLEHIRDQRPGMVRTKQQFEFVLMAVAEEVHAILKALPQ